MSEQAYADGTVSYALAGEHSYLIARCDDILHTELPLPERDGLLAKLMMEIIRHLSEESQAMVALTTKRAAAAGSDRLLSLLLQIEEAAPSEQLRLTGVLRETLREHAQAADREVLQPLTRLEPSAQRKLAASVRDTALSGAHANPAVPGEGAIDLRLRPGLVDRLMAHFELGT
jgi:hypothetical protein